MLKEGVKFRIRIEFVVQREIVTGLKYVQRTTRKSVPVDKMVHMVGSYAPKAEAHQYLTPFEDAPSGMLGRGTYRVTSCFTDDYKNEHLKVKLTLQNSKGKNGGKNKKNLENNWGKIGKKNCEKLGKNWKKIGKKIRKN